ncbi:hypothetical protein MHH33_17655 [Paenisporosarcina sp. FSL H8-0542]|nr:hypothetical protein [Paenisporosarcina sp. HGH0030]
MGKMQFLYQLKLIPSLLEESNWTDKENNMFSITPKKKQIL